MANNNFSSMRVLFDLQPCQTDDSALRGVGRYSGSLFKSVYAQREEREMAALVSSHLPHRLELEIPSQRILDLPPTPAWPTRPDWQGGEGDSLDALAYSRFIAGWNFDVVHVSHGFEGFGAHKFPYPAPQVKTPGQVLSATIYDLIPMVFPEHYFANEDFRHWYLARTEWLRKADLLLAISDSTRTDAIDMLGIDPDRIVTIHNGVDARFVPLTLVALSDKAAEIKKTYGISRDFILYTGGDEFRKNLPMAVSAYAALPAKTRRAHQLVIVCGLGEERKKYFADLGKKLGLAEGDLVLTGYVPDEHLPFLYNTCALFIFPSRYEGQGLPVLEAMACGAPAIGGDNSSIREIIGRKDALFNADSAEDIAAAMQRVLSNPNLAKNLRSYGLKRAKEYSSERAGRQTLEAFDEAFARTGAAGNACATSGWLPKKRLAYLSPMPPSQSGIAYYSELFLPFLARHFEIDLFVDHDECTSERIVSSMRVFHQKDFEATAENYDTILYEFGASTFHLYMFPYLERFPGVVTLHDGYFGGLYNHIEHIEGVPGAFSREMLSSHGPRARRIFLDSTIENTVRAVIDQLPCTKHILDHAIGVISHSPYALELCRKNYPEGIAAPYRVIPQAISFPAPNSGERKKAIREKYGCSKDAFIVTTFGFIARTKGGYKLLSAFLKSSLAKTKNAYLFFAGKPLGDDECNAIIGQLKEDDLEGRIRILGYIDDADYADMYQITDVAVQLREFSRGETSKCVLDALASGVPVVLNNNSGYQNYPDDVVVKVSADPSVAEIARILEQLYANLKLRKKYSAAGLEYVKKKHHPAACATQYAVAVHEMTARNDLRGEEKIISAFAPHLGGCDDTPAACALLDDWLEKAPAPKFRRQKVFIDVSYTAKNDFMCGIMRVVTNIVRNAYRLDRAGFEPVAVELVAGRLVVAKDWLARHGCILPVEERNEDSLEVEFSRGDKLLMVDSSWAMGYSDFFPVFDAARRAGTEIVSVVYDIFPISRKEFVPGNNGFEVWLRQVVEHSDRILGISASMLGETRDWIRKSMPERLPALKFGFFHLGADFAALDRQSKPTDRLTTLTGERFFLMVGTIEPRKNHKLAIDAMKHLWDRGEKVRLVIAGKEGWMVESLMKEIKSEKLSKLGLVFIDTPSDEELAWLYGHASALLFPSTDEGFGLPLIEAAGYGLPVICSDIPVFREIGEEHVFYVNIDNSSSLADGIEKWLNDCRNDNIIDSSCMKKLTWQECARRLIDIIFE